MVGEVREERRGEYRGRSRTQHKRKERYKSGIEGRKAHLTCEAAKAPILQMWTDQRIYYRAVLWVNLIVHKTALETKTNGILYNFLLEFFRSYSSRISQWKGICKAAIQPSYMS